MIVCPSCKGSGSVVISGIVYAPGTSGPYSRRVDCDRCTGQGEIPEEMLSWITKGEQLRKARVSRGSTLRAESQRLEISSSKLSRLERGLEDNRAFDPT